MATYGIGAIGDNVAKIQQFLARLHQSNPKLYPDVTVTGSYDNATATAMKVFQRAYKIPQTGQWDPKTQAVGQSFARYVSKGKSADPFANYQTISNDRSYIVSQWQTLYGRNPTSAEVEVAVNQLQHGTPRTTWVANAEKQDAVPSTQRIFKEIMGRDPTQAETNQYANALKSGQMTRATMRSYLSATPEAQTRAKTTAETPGQLDAKSSMDDLLDNMGLGSLKDWAWQQIKDGKSDVQIEQALRQTPEWQTRFKAITARVDAGLPAMTEGEVLDYEQTAKSLMRQYGMPAGFYDQPDDFVNLIAGNVSVNELNERVQDGFVRVQQAPTEVRNQFAEWYGIQGDTALAAFFLDPEKATPALQRMIATAEVGGVGDQFGIDLTKDRADQIAAAGVTADSARAGFAKLQQMDPLFSETIDETTDITKEDQGADAVFQLGGTGATEVDRRARERTAATSGGGGANVSQQGVAVGNAQ